LEGVAVGLFVRYRCNTRLLEGIFMQLPLK
jgi:hypothetical protein